MDLGAQEPRQDLLDQRRIDRQLGMPGWPVA